MKQLLTVRFANIWQRMVCHIWQNNHYTHYKQKVIQTLALKSQIQNSIGHLLASKQSHDSQSNKLTNIDNSNIRIHCCTCSIKTLSKTRVLAQRNSNFDCNDQNRKFYTKPSRVQTKPAKWDHQADKPMSFKIVTLIFSPTPNKYTRGCLLKLNFGLVMT